MISLAVPTEPRLRGSTGRWKSRVLQCTAIVLRSWPALHVSHARQPPREHARLHGPPAIRAGGRDRSFLSSISAPDIEAERLREVRKVFGANRREPPPDT